MGVIAALVTNPDEFDRAIAFSSSIGYGFPRVHLTYINKQDSKDAEELVYETIVENFKLDSKLARLLRWIFWLDSTFDGWGD
jgi:predicted alpha/beta superfamily hydrolase